MPAGDSAEGDSVGNGRGGGSRAPQVRPVTSEDLCPHRASHILLDVRGSRSLSACPHCSLLLISAPQAVKSGIIVDFASLGGYTACQQLKIAKRAATASRTHVETTGKSPVDRELGRVQRGRELVSAGPPARPPGRSPPAAAPPGATAAAPHVLVYLAIRQCYKTVRELWRSGRA